MDINTLTFIANLPRMPAAQGPKQRPSLPLGPCYSCNGDHLVEDCPYLRQPQPNPTHNVLALTRYCCIDHLSRAASRHVMSIQKSKLRCHEHAKEQTGSRCSAVQTFSFLHVCSGDCSLVGAMSLRKHLRLHLMAMQALLVWNLGNMRTSDGNSAPL